MSRYTISVNLIKKPQAWYIIVNTTKNSINFVSTNPRKRINGYRGAGKYAIY